MMTIFIPLSPISFSSASQATILMSCFLVSCVLFTLFWVLLYVNGIALCPLFFFSTQQYAFKMHPFALLYILFIVSNNYLFIKVYFHRILTIHSPSDGNLYLLSPKQLCIFKTHSADPAIHVGGLDLAFRRPICLKPDTNLLLNTWNFLSLSSKKTKLKKEKTMKVFTEFCHPSKHWSVHVPKMTLLQEKILKLLSQ